MDYAQVLLPLFNTLWYLISRLSLNLLVQRQSLMGLGDEQLHSLVVFVGSSTFKTLMQEKVTYSGGYIRFIKAQTEELLLDSEARTVIETIESGRRAVVPEVPGGDGFADSEAWSKCRQGVFGCKAFPKCRGIVGAS